jgi:hypothetical protein
VELVGVEWLVFALGAGLVGLAVRALLIPIASGVIVPLWKRAPPSLRMCGRAALLASSDGMGGRVISTT